MDRTKTYQKLQTLSDDDLYWLKCTTSKMHAKRYLASVKAHQEEESHRRLLINSETAAQKSGCGGWYGSHELDELGGA